MDRPKVEVQQWTELIGTNLSNGLIVSPSAFAASHGRRKRSVASSKSELGVHTHNLPGGNGGGVIPDPIPNSVVKPSSVDGTAQVTVWESRTPPGSYHAAAPIR